MKWLIVLTLLLFVVLGVIVINLPPREMTMKDLHAVIVPPVGQQIPAPADTSSSDSEVTTVSTEPLDTSLNDHSALPAAAVEDNAKIEYYIIIESIRDHALAVKKAETLRKQYNTDIIVLPPSANGNFRLSYGKYSSSEEAKSVIKSVRKQIRSDAWIYSVVSAVQYSSK